MKVPPVFWVSSCVSIHSHIKGGQNSIFWRNRNRVLTNKRNIPFYPTSIGLFVPKISPVKVNIPKKQSRDKIKTILTFRVPMTSWKVLFNFCCSQIYRLSMDKNGENETLTNHCVMPSGLKIWILFWIIGISEFWKSKKMQSLTEIISRTKLPFEMG